MRQNLQATASGKLLTGGSGALRRICLNRPERLNALDEEMLVEIENLVGAWERQPEIAVLVLASSAAKAFCVGADLERLAQLDGATMQSWELLGNRVLARLEESGLISVASIAGFALGGGLTLAAACDFRIASAKASFGQPEIGLGWIPGWGGVARLVRLAGASQAKRLAMTGEHIAAEEARQLGLVDMVVPLAELESRSEEFAARLAAQSPAALRAIKALADGDSRAQFDALANSILLQDPRGQAAIAAFLSRKRGRHE